MLKKPKMIMFDFGHTLVREFDFSAARGAAAILKYASKNKNSLTAGEIGEFSEKLFHEVIEKASSNGLEICYQTFLRFLFTYLEIEISVPLAEIEKIFWENVTKSEPMPGIDKLLGLLKETGIRSGVISNICFSGETLKNKIDAMLPGHDFEFVVASCDYLFCKPEKRLFEAALKKAGLPPGEVWYCGDNTVCDIAGANGAGIFPVWYHNSSDCFYRDKSLDAKPGCEHLYINDWAELSDIIKEL